MLIGPELDAVLARAFIELPTRDKVALHRLPQVVGAVGIGIPVVLLRVVARSAEINVEKPRRKFLSQNRGES